MLVDWHTSGVNMAKFCPESKYKFSMVDDGSFVLEMICCGSH